MSTRNQFGNNPLVDANGYLLVNNQGPGGGGTSSNFGSGFPSAGTAIGVQNGADMVALVEGQALSAASIPVVIASDQSPVPITGSISTAPVYSHTVNNGGLATVTTSAQLLAANSSGPTPRVGWSIQNVSTTVIFVLLGAGTASATNYHFALPACGSANDGSSLIFRDTQWQGAVQIAAASGTGKVAFEESV
jgi:hypothetical protein